MYLITIIPNIYCALDGRTGRAGFESANVFDYSQCGSADYTYNILCVFVYIYKKKYNS